MPKIPKYTASFSNKKDIRLDAKALSAKQAFNYLNLFKGLDFLQNHYGAEHMLSFEDTVDDLTAICQRNGGQIQ